MRASASRLAGTLERQRELLDPAVANLLDLARAQSSADYHASVLRRYALRETLRAFFTRFDLLLTPTLPCAAFDVGEDTPPGLHDRGPVSWVFYTYAFNLTGHPAASVPAGFTRSGLPVGLQLVARAHREVDLFRAAAAFESAQPWASARPGVSRDSMRCQAARTSAGSSAT